MCGVGGSGEGSERGRKGMEHEAGWCGAEMVRGKGAGGWCRAAPAPQQSPDPSPPQSVQPRALGTGQTPQRGVAEAPPMQVMQVTGLGHPWAGCLSPPAVDQTPREWGRGSVGWEGQERPALPWSPAHPPRPGPCCRGKAWGVSDCTLGPPHPLPLRALLGSPHPTPGSLHPKYLGLSPPTPCLEILGLP